MLQLAQWQQEAGLDVTVWCKLNSPLHQEALRRGLKILSAWAPKRRALWGLPWLACIIRKQKFTHLQLHWSGGVMSFAGIKYLCPNLKLLYHPHMFIDYKKQDFFHRLAYAQLDSVFTAGEKAQQSYLKNLPLKPQQLQMIPYGLELNELSRHRKVAPDYARWNLPADGIYFGYFGRIDRQKGVKEFLQAALPLLAKYPKLHLLLVGDVTRGEQDALQYQSELEQLIKTSGLPEQELKRLHRFGHQKDFLSLMACLNVLVMPSYQETYSLLIINAFALGIPVLSTNEGGTPDLIGAGGERGWLVQARSSEALQNQLIRLLDQPELIATKKADVILYAESHHDHKVVRDQYLKFYRR